jgi:hypothetical protein
VVSGRVLSSIKSALQNSKKGIFCKPFYFFILSQISIQYRIKYIFLNILLCLPLKIIVCIITIELFACLQYSSYDVISINRCENDRVI